MFMIISKSMIMMIMTMKIIVIQLKKNKEITNVLYYNYIFNLLYKKLIE